jgi:hypothetical protein
MVENKVSFLEPHDILRLFTDTHHIRIKKYGKIDEIVVEMPDDKKSYLYERKLREMGIMNKDQRIGVTSKPGESSPAAGSQMSPG